MDETMVQLVLARTPMTFSPFTVFQVHRTSITSQVWR